MAAITLVTILFFASGIAQQEMTLVPAEPETKQPATKPEPLEQAPERPSTAPKPTPKPIGRNVLDPDIGDWLVNLARHEGHLTGARNVRANSLHVLSLLRAAVHSAPNNADAWKFTYDLEYRMGREANAHEALERYSRLRPEDDKAAIDLIRLEIDKAQTADQRAKFAREELAKPRRSRPVQSELQYWLARYHFERGDLDNASTHISKSLLKNPLNIAARELAYEMFGETEPELQRVEVALQLISANPSQVALIWDLGQFLDSLALHQRAQEWFNRAIEVHRRSDPSPVPAENWMQLCTSYLNSGDFDNALRTIDLALELSADDIDAQMLRIDVLRARGETDEADVAIAKLDGAIKPQIDTIIKDERYNDAARLAWFYAQYKREPETAMRLAEFAQRAIDNDPIADIAEALAQHLQGQQRVALTKLGTAATEDQLAAYVLAQALIAEKKPDRAKSIIEQALRLEQSGLGRYLLTQLSRSEDLKADSPPPNTKIIAVLDKFRRDVFDYYERPGDFLRFSITPEQQSIAAAAPLALRFRMENIGPFPITFGEGMMARPMIVLTAGINGSTFRNFTTILMNERPTLLPGDAFEKTVTVDVGEVRRHLLRHIDQPQPIELTAVLDPVFEDGQLIEGMGTQVAGPVNVLRRPLNVTTTGINELLKEFDSATWQVRAYAAEKAGAVLAAKQMRPQDLTISAGDVASLQTALANALNDGSWQVRARTLNAVRWAPLAESITSVASAQVRAENDIVRLMAVRLFAKEHGDKFRPILEEFAAADANESVRLMAASYLPDSAHAEALGEKSPVRTVGN